mmetsp:Transcript_2040/g.5148  ORF Transcript_2040/g.5148 Transcript_2040/m.5148 type:complete len:395 (-) Transcript_2040:256-1440(-)
MLGAFVGGDHEAEGDHDGQQHIGRRAHDAEVLSVLDAQRNTHHVLAHRVEHIDRVEVVLKDARRRVVEREDAHDRVVNVGGVGAVRDLLRRVRAVDREPIAPREKQVAQAKASRLRAVAQAAVVEVILANLGARVGVGEAEGVANLVCRRRLKVVAFPAGEDDLLVRHQRHRQKDEAEDQRRVVDARHPLHLVVELHRALLRRRLVGAPFGGRRELAHQVLLVRKPGNAPEHLGHSDAPDAKDNQSDEQQRLVDAHVGLHLVEVAAEGGVEVPADPHREADLRARRLPHARRRRRAVGVREVGRPPVRDDGRRRRVGAARVGGGGDPDLGKVTLGAFRQVQLPAARLAVDGHVEEFHLWVVVRPRLERAPHRGHDGLAVGKLEAPQTVLRECVL